VDRHFAAGGILARSPREFDRKLGARLRRIRTGNKRGLGEVARAAGISPAQLSQIELGKNAASTWTLARVCAELQVPLARLFERG
jgi:transcriptional regulator with XRE-family HTH domain